MLNDAMKQLELMGIYTTDADNEEAEIKRDLDILLEQYKKSGKKPNKEYLRKEFSARMGYTPSKVDKVFSTYFRDADPKIFQMIKESEDNIKEYKRDINYMKKHGQDTSNVEKWLKEEEITLKAYKNIAKLAPTHDNDATENGAIKQFGQNKETEVMPLEKHPVLAQDDGSLVGKNVWVRSKGQEWRVYVLQDKGDKLYIRDPYNGTQGWISRSKVTGLAGTGTKDASIEKIPANYRPEFPKAGYLVRYAKGMKAKWFATQQEAEAFMSKIKQEGKDCGQVFTKGTKDEYKPNPKVIKILEDLRAHKLSPDAADKMLVQAGVPYVMAGLMVRKPEQYIPVNDEGDTNMKDEKMYQHGEHVKVVNRSTGEKIELKVLRDNKDGTLEVKAPTGAQLTIKKTWIVDSSYNPTFRFLGNVGRKELKQRLDWFKDRKRELEKAISEQKPHSNPEHYYFKAETKEAQRELAEVEESIKNIQQALQKITKDECMEVLKLSGFATDDYDPKKYEGTKRHETNIWYIENEIVKWRNRYENAKDRVNSLNRMVSSGQYGKMTNQELKEANRDLETARMRLEQALSMMKRAKGQKDEAPTDLDG